MRRQARLRLIPLVVFVLCAIQTRIASVQAVGTVTTLAGSGQPDFADGQGTSSSFNTQRTSL